MAIIKRRVNVAAGGSNPNALNGSVFEFLRAPSEVRMGIVGEFGAAVGTLLAKVTIGDSVVQESSPVKIEAAAGRGVNVNEDIDIVDAGLQNQRLLVELVNNDVAARDFDIYVLIA